MPDNHPQPMKLQSTRLDVLQIMRTLAL